MADINLTINLASMLMIGMIFLNERRLLEGQSVHFLPMLTVDLVMLAANALLWLSLKHGNALVCRAAYSVACVCFYAELALFVRYGVGYISRKAPASPWYQRISDAVCAASAAGWVLSAFFDLFYTMNESGGATGRFYLLGQAGGYLVVGLALVLILRYYRTLGSAVALLFLSFALLPCAAAVVRMFWRGADLMPAMISLSLMLTFGFVHMQETMDLRERELQTEKNRVAATLSKLQPQQLYRTLDTARALCGTDSARAQRIIAAFADELREKLDRSILREEEQHDYSGR